MTRIPTSEILKDGGTVSCKVPDSVARIALKADHTLDYPGESGLTLTPRSFNTSTFVPRFFAFRVICYRIRALERAGAAAQHHSR